MAFESVELALSQAASSNPLPGFVAMASLADGGSYQGAFGVRSTARPEPMAVDTVFWIASFTKLVTSVAALQLIEEGRLALDQPVAELVPDFADLPILEGFDRHDQPRLRRATDKPTIRHLLTHTSGLGYAFMDHDLGRYAEQAGIGPGGARLLPRRFEAGTRWQYGVSTDWLGAAIEAASGEGLEAVFERRLFAPLGMADTTFALDEAQKARSAAMHARLADGTLTPIDFAMPPPPNFSLGGGGLYSTAGDYMRLLRALLDGRILTDASRFMLISNQVGNLEAGVLVSSNPALTNNFDPLPGHVKRWSLGLLLNPAAGPNGRAAGSGAWAGLANCYYWIDPTHGLAGVLLSQVLPFADAEALSLFAIFETAVYA